MSKEIVKTTAKIKEIEVVDVFKMLDCNCVTLKLFFERIEQCKLCKKNVCNATRVSNVLKTPAEQVLLKAIKKVLC
jgi:cell fate (sporulation/competence/biofilm development) regulator YmcA (YheA/YmcA/DUF963 family)